MGGASGVGSRERGESNVVSRLAKVALERMLALK